MSATFDFGTQLAIGERYEAELDEQFRQWFDITPATRDEQRSGIDRWFVRKVGSKAGIAGERFAVEYKTDLRAAETGSAFIEMATVHLDGWAVSGWAYSSISRWLVYYLPQRAFALVLSFADLRQALHTSWKHEYRSAHVSNHTWDTYGVLVPLSGLERIARTKLTFGAR